MLCCRLLLVVTWREARRICVLLHWYQLQPLNGKPDGAIISGAPFGRTEIIDSRQKNSFDIAGKPFPLLQIYYC